MFWLLITVVILGIVLCILLERSWKNEAFEKIPGPKGIFLFGNAFDFLMDTVKLFYHFRKLSSLYKRIYKLRLGPRYFIIIYNPEDVETLIASSKNNAKGYLYKFIKPWLKDGLLLSQGQKWQQRRKILTYAFHFNILRHFHSILAKNTRKFCEQLQREVDKPGTCLKTYVHELSLNSICETAMGIELDRETSDISGRYKNGIYTLGQLLVQRIQKFWMHSDLLFSLSKQGRQQEEILHVFKTFRKNIVGKRRCANNFQSVIKAAESNEDDINCDKSKMRKLAMLDLLLQAEREGSIDDEGIGEEVDTFIFEGHDTTATSLQFTLMLLANNQDCQAKVVEECEQILGSRKDEITMEQLSQMKYLEGCIKESLRLYPPVGFFTRKLDQDTKLSGHLVPAGTDCTVIVLDLHRRNDDFKEPLKFWPERFLEQPTWHPYAYIPFSAGPRNCIGQRFAMMEMKLLLSTVLQRYRLLPITKPQDLVFITDFILRTKDPIYVKFEERK